MDQFPGVSAMCLTYGRPHLLEEAIESFVRQDYRGPKEIVVLNDFAQQTLVFNHPEVRIINVPARFRTVGEKRNACAALASYDVLFVWDDDDIYLPWRMSLSIRKLDPSQRFYKPGKAWMLNDGRLEGPNRNLFHSGACFMRSLFDEIGGYRHMGSGQDLELELAMQKLLDQPKDDLSLELQDLYYIYRWGGTGSFHLSGFGLDQPGRATGNDKVGNFVDQQVRTGRVGVGTIELHPRWIQSYETMVAGKISALRELLQFSTPVS